MNTHTTFENQVPSAYFRESLVDSTSGKSNHRAKKPSGESSAADVQLKKCTFICIHKREVRTKQKKTLQSIY